MAAGPEIIKPNIILTADAASHRSYTDGSSNWYDLSGNNNNGTITLGSYDPEAHGGIGMETGNERIHFPPSLDFDHFKSGDFSIETFVRSDDVDYPRSRHPLKIGHTVTSSTTKGWSVGHRASNEKIEVRVADGTNISSTNVEHFELEESTFYHRVFTVSRDNGCLTKCYIDGKLIGSHNATNVTGEIYDPEQSSTVGSGLVFGYVWGWNFIGSVNIIRAYKKILSPEQVVKNYNAIKLRFKS